MFLFLPIQLKAQEDTQHIVSKDKSHLGPTTSESVEKKLREAAEEYQKYQRVDRIAFHDLALPKDRDEFNALNRFAVLFITVVTHDPAELPLKKVYLKSEGSEFELPILSAWDSNTEPDSLVEEVLGSHREDLYVLVPIAFYYLEGELLLNFAKNREGFTLDKLPKPIDLDYLGHVEDAEDVAPQPEVDIDLKTLEGLIRREFPVPLTLDENDE